MVTIEKFVDDDLIELPFGLEFDTVFIVSNTLECVLIMQVVTVVVAYLAKKQFNLIPVCALVFAVLEGLHLYITSVVHEKISRVDGKFFLNQAHILACSQILQLGFILFTLNSNRSWE
jgi:hypothetical protein